MRRAAECPVDYREPSQPRATAVPTAAAIDLRDRRARFGPSLCQFQAPRLVSFARAHAFIRAASSDDGCTLLALDQPTIVPNATGMRPVERAAASLISWLGGGVQPSNTGRLGMFCSASPIWRLLTELGAVENPEEARLATQGLYLMEVFPALALASFSDEFFGRLNGPRYFAAGSNSSPVPLLRSTAASSKR